MYDKVFALLHNECTYYDLVELGQPENSHQFLGEIQLFEVCRVERRDLVMQLLLDLPSIHGEQIKRRYFQTLES